MEIQALLLHSILKAASYSLWFRWKREKRHGEWEICGFLRLDRPTWTMKVATHWDTRMSRQLKKFQWQQRSSCLHCTELNCPRVQGSSNSHWVRSQQGRPAKACWTPIKHMAQNVLNSETLGLGWDPQGKYISQLAFLYSTPFFPCWGPLWDGMLRSSSCPDFHLQRTCLVL